MTKKQPKKDKERRRKEMLDEWSNQPSPNPLYQGKTPSEVAQIMLKAPWKKRGR